MTKNITMAIDEKLLKKARKVAIDKSTTLSAMIRKHLEQLAEQEDTRKNQIIAELRFIFEKSGVKIGRKKWNREKLHAR